MSHSRWRASTSSPVEGSSRKTTSGLPSSASAAPSRRCSPAAQPPHLPRGEPAQTEALVEPRFGHRIRVVRGNEGDDLAHLQSGREPGELRGGADAPANVLVERGAAKEQRFSAVRYPQSQQQAERGGLARAVGSQKGQERAPGQDQIEPRQGRLAGKRLRHAAQLRGRLQHPTRLRSHGHAGSLKGHHALIRISHQPPAADAERTASAVLNTARACPRGCRRGGARRTVKSLLRLQARGATGTSSNSGPPPVRAGRRPRIALW